jgi:hypothetical protein
MKEPNLTFRAVIRLLPPEAGGRTRGVFPGYKPNCSIGNKTSWGAVAFNDAVVVFDEPPIIPSGGEAVVSLWPVVPEFWGSVDAGSEIELYEGSHKIGVAMILARIDEG